MRLTIPVLDQHSVSAIWTAPDDATACFVFAHGAGEGIEHPFMADMSDALARRRIAVLRFNFPFMERGEKRPDRPPLAQATIVAAVETARGLAPAVPVFAGGKSFGGRMTSQAAAAGLVYTVSGLVFLGFPLHPAKAPSTQRAAHLEDVQIPMLFVQGSRDALAELPLLEPVVSQLGERATLQIIAGGDHSFAVPARSGQRRVDVLASLADAVAEWCRQRMLSTAPTPASRRRVLPA